MPPTPFPISPTLDAALSRWEEHARPGLPDRGFSLGRAAGGSSRGIYAAGSQRPVFETREHILRMAVAPGGRRIALQLAERADEDGTLAVLDVGSGTLRRYSDIRCRYEPMVWTSSGGCLALVTRDPHRILRMDVAHEEITADRLTTDARCRLFAVGDHLLIAESRAGRPTRLMRHTDGECLGEFASIVDVTALDDHTALVRDGIGVSAVDAHTGTRLWRWEDAASRVTGVAVADGSVHLAIARGGRSVHLQLAHGVVVHEWRSTIGGSIATISDLGAVDSDAQAVIEGPTEPPRIVSLRPAAEREHHRPSGAGDFDTVWHEFPADDGAVLTALVTSPRGLAGPLPTILACYGGFGVPDLAVFEPTIPAWVGTGCRYVTGHIRGGGEHGERWRTAGRGKNKRRGIDDLLCIARGLVDSGLTSPGRLVLAGASHGGTIVASMALAYPGACAGFVTTAAPLDLTALERHPLGRMWLDEFGDTGSLEGRREVRAISPLHRARAIPVGVRRPRYLGIVLSEDSRVDRGDTEELAAALRTGGGDAAVWEAPRAGHGGNHLDALHDLGAVLLTFAAHTTGHIFPLRGPDA